MYLNSEGMAKPVVVKRSCTEAMLKVLQHELRKTHAKTAQQHEWIDELTLMEIVGKGGFGVVYKGTFKGSVAAVKVRRAGSDGDDLPVRICLIWGAVQRMLAYAALLGILWAGALGT